MSVQSTAGKGQPDSITFLLIELQGSTSRWSDKSAAVLLELTRARTIIYEAMEAARGRPSRAGEEVVCAAFMVPADAAEAAVRAQRGLRAAHWDPAVSISARAAVHVGPAPAQPGEYAGPLLHHSQRILQVANWGQILLSHPAAANIRGGLTGNLACGSSANTA